MKEFHDLVQRRQSCRAFADRAVEPEKLRACIEAARLAPSACNSQPWFFTVVTQSPLREEVASCLQQLGLNSFTADCPAFIVITEQKARLISRLAAVVDSQHYASLDTGIAAAYIGLQATDLGLGTCTLGVFDEARLRELLDIPPETPVRLVIAVGYPAEDTVRPKSRKPLEDVATFR